MYGIKHKYMYSYSSYNSAQARPIFCPSQPYVYSQCDQLCTSLMSESLYKPTCSMFIELLQTQGQEVIQ